MESTSGEAGPSTSKEPEKEIPTNQGPSTSSDASKSSAPEDREIVAMWRQMDERLESKAKDHNLSAINVKSILHHLIKNPQVLSVLMGIEDPSKSGIPTMKLTRSKAKTTTTDGQQKLDLKPVKHPKTFLDLNFVEDEEDEDYQPGNDEEPELSDPSEDEDADVTKETDKTLEKKDELSEGEEDNLQVVDDEDFLIGGFRSPGPTSTSRLRNLNETAVPEYEEEPEAAIRSCFEELVNPFDDGNYYMSTVTDDYIDFLNAVHSTPNQDVEDDDTNDPEYNVLIDDNLDEVERDPDELRHDKGTEIPRREVEALYMDLISDEAFLATIPAEKMQALTPKKLIIGTEMERERGRAETKVQAQTRKRLEMLAALPPLDDSCTLLGEKDAPVRFRPQELEQLREQLLAHVQLLTQFVVLTTYVEPLQNVRNQAQTMINELDDYSLAGGKFSMFSIETLPESLVSCHDILSVLQLPEDRVNWLAVSHPSNHVNDGNPLYAPRPEAALVLSRSLALRFPSLVPLSQPRIFVYSLNKFINEENLLYAMGLMQFGHIPVYLGPYETGNTRYSLIQKHFLPIKTEAQIKNHLKNTKNSTAVDKNPAMKILLQASEGVCQLVFKYERRPQRLDPMSEWPKELQPVWYEYFKASFSPVSNYKMMPIAPIVSIASSLQITSSLTSNAVSQPDSKIITPLPESKTAPVHASMEYSSFKPTDFGLSMSDVTTMAYSGKSTPIESDVDLQIVEGSDQEVDCDVTLTQTSSRDKRTMNESPESSQQKQAREESHENTLQYLTLTPGPSTSRSIFNQLTTPPETIIDEGSCLPLTPGAHSPLSRSPVYFHLVTSPENTRSQQPSRLNVSLIPTPAKGIETQLGQPTKNRRRSGRNLFLKEETVSKISVPSGTSCISSTPEPFDTSAMFEPTSHSPSSISSRDSTTQQFLSCVEALKSHVTTTTTTPHSSIETPKPPALDDFQNDGTFKKKLKRGRTEIESLGEARMNDGEYRKQQMALLAKKVASDILLRMFMHKEIHERMNAVLNDENQTIAQKLASLRHVLADLPEVYFLISSFVDEHALPDESHRNAAQQKQRAFRDAIQMICDIDAYLTGTQRYPRSAKTIFKALATLDERLSTAEIKHRLFELVGAEKPLWKRLKRHCGDEYYEEDDSSHEFEFVDLQSKDDATLAAEAHFELVDDLDTLLGEDQRQISGYLQVDDSGQLLSRNSTTGNVVPIRMEHKGMVNEERLVKQKQTTTQQPFTRSEDLALLTAYNADEDSLDSFLAKTTLPNRSKLEIEERIKFLLSHF